MGAQIFLSEENARLRARLRQLEEDISDEVNAKSNDLKLVEQLKQLQKTDLSTTSDSNMTGKLERSETRVRALQEQLQLNASEWGKQKTQMEIEITKLRAQVTSLIRQIQPANKVPVVERQLSQNAYTGLSGSVTKPVSL